MDQAVEFWYKSNMALVKNYNLFGEQGDLPDVVHCETIEARSLIHDWEFQPHRHARLHQFLLLETGQGEVLIEDGRRTLTGGDLVNLPMGVVHGLILVPGAEGLVLTVAAELMDASLQESEGLRPLLQCPGILKATQETREIMQAIFAEYPKQSFARAHILRALCAVLAGQVARVLATRDPAAARAEHGLQRRFEALLEAHHLEHLGVADYASRLAVTPTHLSRVMRQATGQSASAAIEQRVIREARRNLAFSNLSVSEVSYQLGYGDPSYFSRVFKRAAGQSPREFRRRLEADAGEK